ncbi:MAG: hemin receptor [Prevotella sp.]|nr:hemin receptor [Prevotella sp.]
MKKLFAIAAIVVASMPAAAQETYENAKIAQEDLNGTARYVAMGGAMEALGADISTINTNPAGIGMFRHSNISLSMGMVSQDGAKNALGGTTTNASFDQLGFVYSYRSGRTSYINVGLNYHKSRNFDMILSASNKLANASLNKLTWAKGNNGYVYEEKIGTDGTGTGEPNFDAPYITCNQIDDLFGYNLNWDDANKDWGYVEADNFRFDRSHQGYIGEYDINVSGNIDNRIYLGLTVGIHDVHYKHYSEYVEEMPLFTCTVGDSREITGQGIDVKAGVILRPVEYSPFRIGLYVSTPTFYELKTANYSFISDGKKRYDTGSIMDARERSNYKFRLYTPWKFGVSLGHTIGSQLALGASYEYADYASLDSRYITGEYYDDYSDSYRTQSESDRVMNEHTAKTLKGVHTLKLGAEIKPMPNFALRLGYNYVSPMYQKEGFKDGTLNSDASYISSATDYTNWEATNRYTCGFGYTFDKFNVSMAYQYSTTKGTFSPFMSYYDPDDAAYDCVAPQIPVTNKRHQLLFTLGYTF